MLRKQNRDKYFLVIRETGYMAYLPPGPFSGPSIGCLSAHPLDYCIVSPAGKEPERR